MVFDISRNVLHQKISNFLFDSVTFKFIEILNTRKLFDYFGFYATFFFGLTNCRLCFIFTGVIQSFRKNPTMVLGMLGNKYVGLRIFFFENNSAGTFFKFEHKSMASPERFELSISGSG